MRLIFHSSFKHFKRIVNRALILLFLYFPLQSVGAESSNGIPIISDAWDSLAGVLGTSEKEEHFDIRVSDVWSILSKNLLEGNDSLSSSKQVTEALRLFPNESYVALKEFIDNQVVSDRVLHNIVVLIEDDEQLRKLLTNDSGTRKKLLSRNSGRLRIYEEPIYIQEAVATKWGYESLSEMKEELLGVKQDSYQASYKKNKTSHNTKKRELLIKHLKENGSERFEIKEGGDDFYRRIGQNALFDLLWQEYKPIANNLNVKIDVGNNVSAFEKKRFKDAVLAFLTGASKPTISLIVPKASESNSNNRRQDYSTNSYKPTSANYNKNSKLSNSDEPLLAIILIIGLFLVAWVLTKIFKPSPVNKENHIPVSRPSPTFEKPAPSPTQKPELSNNEKKSRGSKSEFFAPINIAAEFAMLVGSLDHDLNTHQHSIISLWRNKQHILHVDKDKNEKFNRMLDDRSLYKQPTDGFLKNSIKIIKRTDDSELFANLITLLLDMVVASDAISINQVDWINCCSDEFKLEEERFISMRDKALLKVRNANALNKNIIMRLFKVDQLKTTSVRNQLIRKEYSKWNSRIHYVERKNDKVVIQKVLETLAELRES